MAALHFCKTLHIEDADFAYLVTAENVVLALSSGSIERAVVAFESPIGSPVEETRFALEGRNPQIISEADLEVRHSVVARKKLPFEQYTTVYSHPIALSKHHNFLSETFSKVKFEEFSDSGAAARDLAEGKLGDTALVIAMPTVCNEFNLVTVVESLPGNDNYLTRFLLLEGV